MAADGDDRVLGSVTFCPPGSTVARDRRATTRASSGCWRWPRTRAAAGVGEALVRACLDRAREPTAWPGVAISTMDLMTGAHRLYERLGFSRVPEADWSPVNGVCLLAFRIRF